MLGASLQSNRAQLPAPALPEIPDPDFKIQNGRIRQSVMSWCFKPMPMEQLIDACHKMGMPAMEGIDRKFYPRMRELGMKPAIVGSHGFSNGPVNPDNRAACVKALRDGIDVAVKYGSPNVITFTGMRD
jgi:hydroxypyruvate isomerase